MYNGPSLNDFNLPQCYITLPYARNARDSVRHVQTSFSKRLSILKSRPQKRRNFKIQFIAAPKMRNFSQIF